MSRYGNLLGTIISIWLLGCSSPASTTTSTVTLAQGSVPPSPTPQSLGQMLPISAQAIISGKKIELEVTQTPEQQALGLMYRTALPDNRGMLFQFNPPQPVNFWMKNVQIPLDMVFLRKGVVRKIAANVPPCTTDPCPTYGPGTPIDQVIELRGGRAAELGLKVGDRIPIQFLQNQSPP